MPQFSTDRSRITASPFWRRKSRAKCGSGFCDEVEDDQARVIAANVGDVRVISIYAPNGQAVGSPAYQYKMEWYRRLTNCLKETKSVLERVVVCGDFNVAPNDEDVHDPALWRGAIMCSEGERAAFRALEELGLADTLRLHHPEPGIFSWWDYRMLAFPKNRGLRIDAILAGSELAAKCSDAGVDREMRKGKDPSDHAPVWAEFGKVVSSRRRRDHAESNVAGVLLLG